MVGVDEECNDGKETPHFKLGLWLYFIINQGEKSVGSLGNFWHPKSQRIFLFGIDGVFHT